MVSYRDATAGDLPAVAALVNSAYRGEPSRSGWTTEADLLGGQRTDAEALAEELAHTPEASIVLAYDEERLVGCVRLEPGEAHGAPGALYVGMLTVDPRRQAAGLGRGLLVLAESRARARNCDALIMTVIAQRTDLIDWYARRGYEATGEVQPFPYGQPRFGEPSRADLSFVVLRRALA